MSINPQTVLKILAFIAGFLKWGWIKDGIRLPLAPEFWERFSHMLLDDHKFDTEEAIDLLQVCQEYLGWDWAWEAAIWLLGKLKPFEFSITDEKWKEFWEPIVVSVQDGVLLWTEVGWILGTIVDWVKKQLEAIKKAHEAEVAPKVAPIAIGEVG